MKTTSGAIRYSARGQNTFTWVFIFTLLGLLIFGSIMLYSASIALADSPKYPHMSQYFFLLRHIIFILIGLVAACVIFGLPMSFWEKVAPYLLAAVAIALVLVYIPHVGKMVNHSRRWIPLYVINLQPSEIAKFATIIFVPYYLERFAPHQPLSLKYLTGLVGIVGTVFALILFEPDLGSAMVVAALLLVLLWCGRVSFRYIMTLIILVSVIGVLLILLVPFRHSRLMSFRDPFNETFYHSASYQLAQSLIAIGRGGWFGEGLGASIGKLHYLPEAHTDFIVAIIAEELGTVGILIMMFAFSIIIWYCFYVAKHARTRRFDRLVATGIGTWISVQVVINIGVCSGLLPTKGLTLPFISYGGSSMVMMLCAIGVVCRVSYENYLSSQGKPKGGLQ